MLITLDGVASGISAVFGDSVQTDAARRKLEKVAYGKKSGTPKFALIQSQPEADGGQGRS